MKIVEILMKQGHTRKHAEEVSKKVEDAVGGEIKNEAKNK